MPDDAQYRKLLEEVEAMRRRLDEIADALKQRIGAAPAADPALPPGPESGPSHVLEILDMGEDFRRILTFVIRTGGSSTAEIARETGDDESTVRVYLKTLVAQGHLRKEAAPDGTARWLPVLGQSRTRASEDTDVWKRLGL